MKKFKPNPIQANKLKYHSNYVTAYNREIINRQNIISKDEIQKDHMLEMYRSRIKNHHNEITKVLNQCYK
jgi:hypothetical protein